MTQLDVTLTPQNEDTWILHLTGTIDAATHHLMWSAESSALLIEQLVEAQVKTLIIDLTNVERIDSQGLGVILSAYKEFSTQDIEVVLQNPNPHLYRLFRLMQFDQVFSIKLPD